MPNQNVIFLSKESQEYLQLLNEQRAQHRLLAQALFDAMQWHVAKLYAISLDDQWQLDLDRGMLLPTPPPPTVDESNG